MNSKNTILFLVHSLSKAGSQDAEAWKHSEFLASTRLQLGPARVAAEKLGLTINAINLRSEEANCLQKIGNPRCCIIGKLNHPDNNYAARITMANLAGLAVLKSKNIPTGITYCDNSASALRSPISTLYQSLLHHGDHIIYPSQTMMSFGKQWVQKGSTQKHWVIEDPCFLPTQPFRTLSKKDACKIIWFGHNSNLQYLIDNLESIIHNCNSDYDYELTILSDEGSCRYAEKHFKNISNIGNWKLRLVRWDTKNQPFQLGKELSRSHICLIPSDPKDPRKSGASHNRAVDALISGCAVVAAPLPSYVELRKSLILSNKYSDAINFVINDYQRLAKKWSITRENDLRRFRPCQNVSSWERVIKTMINH